MIGMPLMSCIAPEHRELAGAAVNSPDMVLHEYLAIRKDGSVFPVEMQQRVTEVSGRSVHVSAIRDISDQKKAEAEIKEAKEIAEAVLDSLPGTFFVIDDQLELIRWNKNFEKVGGFTTEELMGKSCFDFIDEKDRDAVAKRIGEASVHGAISLEAMTITKAGERVPFLFNAVWRTLGDRRYLLGTGMDLSDRIKAEESLRRSEGLFRLAFETSPDAVAITSVERGIFVDVNQSFSEILGYSKEEVLGKSSLDLKIWADPHVRDEMLKGIATKGVVRNVQVRIRTKEGTLIEGLFSGGTIQLEGESFVLSSVRDITDMKKAEDERLKLERQVQHAQKLESLGVLAGGIAHDFNNILTSILGNADLGLVQIPPTAPARKNIEEIKNGALRAAGLANQMLAYSGKGRFELKAIDLSELVREMAQLLDVSISKKAVLMYNLDDDLPLVECDVNQIRQIVMNLITNASESLGQESGTIRISTASMFCDRKYLDTVSDRLQSSDEQPLPEGVYVSLEVSDTGCGMDLETQTKVFDPFFTTKFTGRGLGLAALRGIVYGHKGAVKVYSEAGKGSTFKVLFPAKKDVQKDPIEKTENGDFRDIWQERIVLIADDEAIVCNVAKEMLEELGLTVLTASDGNQAVEVFKENFDRIACVLLDLTMPGLDGSQVFYEMQRIKPDVRVILSSGYNEQDVTQRFVGTGLAGFIQKPYTIAKLTEKLNSVFGKT
jgi:two-component system cell cycle sensor histidine kinase/response regulator CckA